MLAVKSIGLKAGLTEARMEIQDLIEDYELRTKTMENKVIVFRCKKFVLKYISERKMEDNNMISFASDYIAGAHPVIMQRLLETNMENLSGYGTDQYCAQAKEKIKQAFQCPNGEVFFLVGGTQTNQVIISTMLAPYEGVIAAKTGHVSVHEAGAIEYSGHKVIE